MTAETDALRLMPVEPTEAMLAAGQAAGDYGDALKKAYRAMLSAAPAVQPAAGRSDWTDEDAKRYIADWCPDHVKDYIDRLAALSPQPGPASEGDPAHD